MPIAHEFDYYKPKDLKEVLNLLSRHKGKAKVLAGGTDLLNWLKEGLAKPEVLVDIKGLELGGIELRDGFLSIGALVTYTNIKESEVIRKHFPLLWEASRVMASTGVRNRATLTGNICSAVPSLEGGPPLLVYEAKVQVLGPRGKREIPIAGWFIGPKKTALKEDEFVTGVVLPVPAGKNGACYVKLRRYEGEDLAQVGVGIMISAGLPADSPVRPGGRGQGLPADAGRGQGNAYRIAFGAVGPIPKRAAKIEALLNGKKLTDALIRKAVGLVASEISPITDIRSSKEYRLHMARVMLERGLKAAASRLAGKGPKYGESLI